MKLMWILCFALLHQHACKADETSTLDTTLSNSEITSTLSSDITTESPTVAPTTENVSFTTPTTTSTTESSTSPTTEAVRITTSELAEINSTEVFIKLTNQIRLILEHLQEVNATGLPGDYILPDPLSAPNVSEGGLFGSSEFYNITVHGLSNFTVESVNMLLDQMTVYVKIRVKRLYILGNSSVSTAYFFKSEGPFDLTLNNVTAEGVVYLVVKEDGSLRANRTVTTVKYDHMMFHIGENSSAPLGSAVSAAGLAAATALLPFITDRIDERLTAEVNKQLKNSPKFTAIRDISPVDLAILRGREYVAKHYDPYTVQNIINFDSNFFALVIGPVTLHGLSKFARVGAVSIGMENRTMIFKLRMVTGRVCGESQFNFNFGKVGTSTGRLGRANFSIEHLQFEAVVHQPLSLKKQPLLQDLQLEVGPLKVKLDDKGDFDYFVELAVRQLPDFFRYYIIDILEEPIKRRIQSEILDKVNVEDVVISNLPLFEKLLLQNKL